MLVKITQTYIDKNNRHSSRWCPVARGLRAAGCQKVMVGADCAWIGGKQVFLPAKVKRFIHRFDTGWSVRPFKFELEV